MSFFRAARILRAGPGKEFKFPVVVNTATINKRGAFADFIYNTFLKKTSSYFLTLGVLAWTFDYALDYVVDNYYVAANKGRSFNDVIATFPEIPPNCGDDDDEEDEE